MLSQSYIAAKETIPMPSWLTEDLWWSFYGDWDQYPIYLDGECVGGVLVKGEELHICVREHAKGRVGFQIMRIWAKLKHRKFKTNLTSGPVCDLAKKLGWKVKDDEATYDPQELGI